MTNDLTQPGVQDSNAARARVAEDYKKSCSSIWIVAPITRAVDDKTAKNLLTNRMRDQLKLDGHLDLVTVICTKSDEITISEAEKLLSPDVREQIYSAMGEFENQSSELHQRHDSLRDGKVATQNTLAALEKEIELWETLDDRLRNGEMAYSPVTSPNKRKRSERVLRPRKNGQQDLGDDSDSSGSEMSEDELADAPIDASPERGAPLSEAEVKSKLSSLKEERKTGRAKKKGLEKQLSETKKLMKECKAEHDLERGKLWSLCIKARNDYARNAIRRDFAASRRE